MKDIVTEAREWIGTPYRHQGATKGVGCDCLGLVRGIWRVQRGAEPEMIPAYSSDWAEPQHEERLWAAMTRHFQTVAHGPLAPGEVILLRMRDAGVAKHLGVVSATGFAPRFIHAYGHHGVIESPLSAPWARRIVARFEFKKEVR